eukprot:COSAG02_NODE_439_length_22308_cov_18.013508_5_plen_171_part_00
MDGSSASAGSVALCIPAGQPLSDGRAKDFGVAVVVVPCEDDTVGGGGGGSGDGNDGGGGGSSAVGAGDRSGASTCSNRGDGPCSKTPVATASGAASDDANRWACDEEAHGGAAWRRWYTATFAATSTATPTAPRVAVRRRGIFKASSSRYPSAQGWQHEHSPTYNVKNTR